MTDRRQLIGKDVRQRRQVAGQVARNGEEPAHGLLGAGDAVEVAHAGRAAQGWSPGNHMSRLPYAENNTSTGPDWLAEPRLLHALASEKIDIDRGEPCPQPMAEGQSLWLAELNP